ncbi:uncharacterized protein PHALS_04514 [Plasmopara halstedii]|uniref:Uncharacterized protein n=1 Tax=Plasmopara halstedii TaxID=4781 RepID=A0A0N7L3X0_PLAHL|nr:uncharacterized protein PHALS_04514 [Plasmopara halstedii]CEG37051.1 hypothetical protein PHALS_04514 [Plasmopara halstedii]|eukprot:XP_024573420.1 hypothetical protein PHALS_04514 [Plasmopara halstedii]
MALLINKANLQASDIPIIASRMAHPIAFHDAPMSPLSGGLNDDLLAALDEMLGVTSDAPSTLDPLSLDTNVPAEVYEKSKLPHLYDKSIENRIPVSMTVVQPQSEPQENDIRLTPYLAAKPHRRKRPKDELNYLRATVAHLEAQLKKLNQSTKREFFVGNNGSELFARWKQVAERQKDEANKTVIENLKLRAMLKAQLEIAHRLESAITEQQNEAMTSASPWNSFNVGGLDVHAPYENTGNRPRAPSITDDYLFAELNDTLEEQYAQVDAVLEASGLANVNSEFLSKIQPKQDAKGILFSYREVRLLPFSMVTVARVLWSFLLLNSGDLPGSIQTRILSDDHINITFVDTIQLSKSRNTKVNTRLALRRFSEANRVVVVWSSYLEIAGSVFVRLREKGFNVTSTFNFLGGSDGISSLGSILRAVVDIKPERVVFKTGSDAKSHFEEMTDLILNTYHRNFGLIKQLIENLLLNDLLATSAS